MPIIVDEVVISMDVTNQAAAGGASAASTDDNQQLIDACVERILDILRQKNER